MMDVPVGVCGARRELRSWPLVFHNAAVTPVVSQRDLGYCWASEHRGRCMVGGRGWD